MKILFNTVGRCYENEVCKQLEADGHAVFRFTNNESAKAISDFQQTKEKCAFMVHISNTKGVSSVTKQMPGLLDGKSVVLMSSFQTWGGKRYSQPIADIEKQFNVRMSSQAFSRFYKLENSFYSACKMTRKGCIVGVGLVYGKGGLDFEEVFTSLWNDVDMAEKKKRIEAGEQEGSAPTPGAPILPPTTSVLSDSGGANRVPMVHVTDLARMLLYAAETYGKVCPQGVAAGTGAGPSEAHFLPATDVQAAAVAAGAPGSAPADMSGTAAVTVAVPSSAGATASWSLAGVFSSIGEQLHRSVRFTTQDEVVEQFAKASASGDSAALLCNGALDWMHDIAFLSALPPPTTTADSARQANGSASSRKVVVPTLQVPGAVVPSVPTNRSSPGNVADKAAAAAAASALATTAAGQVDSVVVPSLTYPNGLTGSSTFRLVWSEFLQAHRLTPCVIIAAGGPKTGKTAVAQHLARCAGLNVLEPIGCVKSVLSLPAPPVPAADLEKRPASRQAMTPEGAASATAGAVDGAGPATGTMSSRTAMTPFNSAGAGVAPVQTPAVIGANLRARVVAAVESILRPPEDAAGLVSPQAAKGAAAAKGAKKGSVAEVSGGSAAIDVSTVSEDTIRQLPKAIIRQCIAFQIYSGVIQGVTKGYVLDVNWDTTPSALAVFESNRDFLDVFSCKDLIDVPQSSNTGKDTGRALTGRSSAGAQNAAAVAAATKEIQEMQANMIWPDLVLDLQADSVAIARRQMIQWGVAPDLPVNKLSKDQQASLNALNVDLAAYLDRCLPIGTVIQPDAAADSTTPRPEGEAPPADAVAAADKPPVDYRKVTHRCLCEMERPYNPEEDMPSTSNRRADSWRPLVRRVDLTSTLLAGHTNAPLTEGELKPLVETGKDSVLGVYTGGRVHGAVGWLSNEKFITPLGKEPPEPVEPAEGEVAEAAATTGEASAVPDLASRPTSARGPHGTVTIPAERGRNKVRHGHHTTGGVGKDEAGRTDIAALTFVDTDRIGDGYMKEEEKEDPTKYNINKPNIEMVNKSLLQVAEPADKETLTKRATDIQGYLVNNVLTFAAEGLIQMSRSQPEDPIAFLYKFLIERGEQLQKDTEEQAFRNFIQPLSAKEVKGFFASRGEPIPEEYRAKAEAVDEDECVAGADGGENKAGAAAEAPRHHEFNDRTAAILKEDRMGDYSPSPMGGTSVPGSGSETPTNGDM